MAATIHSILDEFRAAATAQRGGEDAYERLMASYMLTDPIYTERFNDVWLWAKWPNRAGADTGIDLVAKEHYRVEEMAFAQKAKAVDKSTIKFNSRVRLGGIPSEAYEYVVNRKPAIEWVMERY